MPYAFVPLGCAPDAHAYLPLNRGLKPLGVVGHGRVRFRDFAAQAVVFRTDPHAFEGGAHGGAVLLLEEPPPAGRVVPLAGL
jgi:hypothetical protein